MSVRVLQLVCGDGFAGVERYVVRTSRALADRGIEVSVVGGDRPSMLEGLDGSGVSWRPGSTSRQALSAALRSDADVVHAHMTQAEAVGAVAAGLRRRPLVATRHFAAPRGSSAAAHRLGALIERRTAAEIAISDYVADRVATARRPVVVRTGVEDVPEPRRPRARERVVLLAQRLEAEKDTSTALRAWAASTGPSAGWRLLVAGRGSEELRLKQLVTSLGVETSVDFLGHRSDVAALYERAAVLVAPTPVEGLGLSVVEAMAHALPVVATAAGGHLESVGAVDRSVLFTPGDAGDAARRIDDLIADPERRRVLGERLRERQQRAFGIEAQAAATIAVYESVVATGTRAR